MDVVFGFVFLVAWLLFFLVCQWVVFTKAGKPGWACLVPIYNIVIILEIAGRPLWWMLLLLVPLVNIIVSIVVCFDLAHVFGKSRLWGLFMLGFFSFIGWPVLAFGNARYTPPDR